MNKDERAAVYGITTGLFLMLLGVQTGSDPALLIGLAFYMIGKLWFLLSGRNKS
jgi:hypothetical protein